MYVSKQLTRCLMPTYCHDLRDAEATFELATNRFMSQIMKRQICNPCASTEAIPRLPNRDISDQEKHGSCS